MKIEGKICFLGGGKMAEALINGILKAELVTASQIVAIDLAADRRELLAEKFGIETGDDASVISGCDIVILAVKPQVVTNVLGANKSYFTSGHLVISIAAGISLIYSSLPLLVVDVDVSGLCPTLRHWLMKGLPRYVVEHQSQRMILPQQNLFLMLWAKVLFLQKKK